MLEYEVIAEQVVRNISTARAKRAQIYFDSSPGQSEHLLNPAELLLSAFAACLLKDVKRLSPKIRLNYQRATVRGQGVREDRPPRLTHIEWILTLWTDDPRNRVDLFDRHLRKHGTIYNTLAASCEVVGHIITQPTTEQNTEDLPSTAS